MENNVALEEDVLDKSKFIPHISHDRIFLDFNIQEQFEYGYNFSVFPFFWALCDFLDEYTNTNIYLTNKEEVKGFEYHHPDILVNIVNLIEFCNSLRYSKNKGQIKAFFGQHLTLSNVKYTEEERAKFIKENFTEKDFLHTIRSLSKDSQKRIIDTIIKLKGDTDNSSRIISSDNFIKIFADFLDDNLIQNSVLQNLPLLQINTLRTLKNFVEENLDKNETFFSDWIDEDKGKYRRQRCLIFGIEYIDPKREGEINGRKRFDILATQNGENHILIELKSPKAEIFKIDENENHNNGYTTSYMLSKDISRAIPQILGYKKWYGQLNAENIQKLGIKKKKKVSKCIIVIGHREDDEVWKENFESLKNSLSIEIWTYNDLVDKMENTIKNLEENL